LAASAVVLFFAADPVAAKVDGPCAIIADGQDLADVEEVAVPENGSIAYDISSAAGVASWTVMLNYGPVSQQVSEGSTEDGGSSAQGVANVSDYAWMGVGVYELHADALLADGRTCGADFLVHVSGNPLLTVVGAAGAAMVGGGAVGLGAMVWLGLKP
jgi:hypothetical protein